MSDLALRSAIRAYSRDPSPENAAAGVVAWVRAGSVLEAQPPPAAFVAAWLAAGGRDPRRDPRPGDVVEGTSENSLGRYRPRRWTVVSPRPLAPPLSRGESAKSYFALFDPATRRSLRLVRRERTGADKQKIVETVTLDSWQRAFRRGTILRAACESCEGTTSAPSPDVIDAYSCPACFGTGHAIFDNSEKSNGTSPNLAASQTAASV